MRAALARRVRIASASYLAASANLPELGEAHDQPGATEDRCRHGHTEIFVDPFGGQRREVLGGELDDVLVLAAIVVRLLEIACGDDAKPQVPEALGDLQGAGAGRECLVQLVER